MDAKFPVTGSTFTLTPEVIADVNTRAREAAQARAHRSLPSNSSRSRAIRVVFGSDKNVVRATAIEAARAVPFTLPDSEDRRTQVWLVGFGDLHTPAWYIGEVPTHQNT